jgi:hypothetical protein
MRSRFRAAGSGELNQDHQPISTHRSPPNPRTTGLMALLFAIVATAGAAEIPSLMHAYPAK